MASTLSLAASSARRGLDSASKGLARRCISSNVPRSGNVFEEPIPPGHTLESVKPPKYWSTPDPVEPDPMSYVRKPVTSAHAIDLSSDPPKLSARDSAALSPTGSVLHGRYGELAADVAQGIPLEYLALLRPAAEGAAALREIASSSSSDKGTLLVYGATQPNAMATAQLASADGHAVIAVVGGEHSGKDDMMETMKNLISEPGTAVPEEFALVKANFRDLVLKTVTGDDSSTWVDTSSYLPDFYDNLMDYVAAYPDTLPAAVTRELTTFDGKEKDRKYFKDNMEAYLSQFPSGAPPIDPNKLKEYFGKEQYAAWKAKFSEQTTAVISGDDTGEFAPATIVRDMTESPEQVDDYILNQENVTDGPTAQFIPYHFSVLKNNLGQGLEIPKGGPILGAVIAVTQDLKAAADAVDKAGDSLRAKAEALHFLTEAQKNAFAAACSVAALAKQAGKSVLVVGGELPGFTTVEPTDDDVQEALSAMEIEEDGTSRLNYFIQIYRAGDYPVYADYAIHRATEELAGPRQIVVTK